SSRSISSCRLRSRSRSARRSASRSYAAPRSSSSASRCPESGYSIHLPSPSPIPGCHGAACPGARSGPIVSIAIVHLRSAAQQAQAEEPQREGAGHRQLGAPPQLLLRHVEELLARAVAELAGRRVHQPRALSDDLLLRLVAAVLQGPGHLLERPREVVELGGEMGLARLGLLHQALARHPAEAPRLLPAFGRVGARLR